MSSSDEEKCSEEEELDTPRSTSPCVSGPWGAANRDHVSSLSRAPPTMAPTPKLTPVPTPTPTPAPTPALTAKDEKATLEVMAFGTVEMFNRPCVDCGRITGNFCDYCLAKDRAEDEEWAAGQRTPLCMPCDRSFDMCHFCRGQLWARQPAWGQDLEGCGRA